MRRASGAAGGSRDAGWADPFKYDMELLAGLDAGGDLRLAGADEVGRGCLAGPLVAAAVVFDYAQLDPVRIPALTDSKRLSPAGREGVFGRILIAAAEITWTTYSPRAIDETGLHRCNLAALGRALDLLKGGFRLAVVDGFDLGRRDPPARRLVGGDHKSAVVAAASVVAKVVRDRLMRSLDVVHPGYGFAEHVGYATFRHKEALRENGPCRLHRMTFQGVCESQLELWPQGD